MRKIWVWMALTFICFLRQVITFLIFCLWLCKLGVVNYMLLIRWFWEYSKPMHTSWCTAVLQSNEPFAAIGWNSGDLGHPEPARSLLLYKLFFSLLKCFIQEPNIHQIPINLPADSDQWCQNKRPLRTPESNGLSSHSHHLHFYKPAQVKFLFSLQRRGLVSFLDIWGLLAAPCGHFQGIEENTKYVRLATI